MVNTAGSYYGGSGFEFGSGDRLS